MTATARLESISRLVDATKASLAALCSELEELRHAVEVEPVVEAVEAEVLMSQEDVAVTIGVSVKTLSRWRYEGHGPRFKKVGRRVVYTRQELNRWLSESSRSSTSDAKGMGQS